MSGFLLDEHVPVPVKARLRQIEPTARVYAIGDAEAPPKRTPDPDILFWAEAHDCLLVTNNRATMPPHLARHLASGHHVPGIVLVPRRFGIAQIVADLLLVWGASLPGEFQDQIIYLPLRHAGRPPRPPSRPA